mmetsp:Transcript_82040/g.237212  ORF Transcript_82040/g.237212 Transcript_82040/m.237212 type:complete len:201 (-) Transcript_82040:250-852(-)
MLCGDAVASAPWARPAWRHEASFSSRAGPRRGPRWACPGPAMAATTHSRARPEERRDGGRGARRLSACAPPTRPPGKRPSGARAQRRRRARGPPETTQKTPDRREPWHAEHTSRGLEARQRAPEAPKAKASWESTRAAACGALHGVRAANSWLAACRPCARVSAPLAQGEGKSAEKALRRGVFAREFFTQAATCAPRMST